MTKTFLYKSKTFKTLYKNLFGHNLRHSIGFVSSAGEIMTMIKLINI